MLVLRQKMQYKNESVSKIKFSIPLVLPTSNTREYYQKYVKD